MKTIRDLGEFGLIAQLRRQLRSRYIGDDCAVLPGSTPGRRLLYTCDPVVEGIHFLPATPARQVGWKAMARNLSDIAAMGGQPRWAVVSLGLRATTPVRYVRELYAGLQAVARPYGCKIVGGDITHVRREQFVVVALVGEVERHRLTLRSGARPGDRIFVTGPLGGARAGKHLRFTPRLREARWLTDQCRIHAMLDISDGLASDLQRLAEASQVGVNIVARQIPRTGSLHAALTEGEDFELLCTVSARNAGKLRAKFFEIGSVIVKPGVFLDGRPLAERGYDHFPQRR